MRTTRWLAALLGAAAVVLGAFGAHALRDGFTATQAASWQTAVSYLFWHVLAALVASHHAAIERRAQAVVAAVLFLAGGVLFSGSLFALALSAPRELGAITPIGGLLLVAGWLSLVSAYMQSDAPVRAGETDEPSPDVSPGRNEKARLR